MSSKRIDQLNALEMQQALQEKANILHQRSEQITLSVLDTFEMWMSMAEDPANPANRAARNLIQRYVEVHNRMVGMASGLYLPTR